MRGLASLSLLGLCALVMPLALIHGGPGGGGADAPAPPGPRPPQASVPVRPPTLEPDRRLVPPAPAEPQETFEELFARALALLPPGRLVDGSCAPASAFPAMADPAWEEVRGLLLLAAARPEAAERALVLLAESLAVLARHLPGAAAADRKRVGEELGRLQDPLARIQAAAFLVQLELQARAQREPRPRPRVSPTTEYAARLLELLPLSSTAAGMVIHLLGEHGVEPEARRCYLRGCHRTFLEGLLEPCETAPWVAGAASRLLERLLANMLALGETTAVELAAEGQPAPDLGVPWESREAEAVLARAWERAGRDPAPRAYQARRALTAAFLARSPDVPAGIHAAERFYRSYPRFFSLTPDAWPNLAWKPSGARAIMAWIRACAADPERERGALDALTGLDLGGGLVDRAERGLVERFFLELWAERGFTPALRGRALVLAASGRTLPTERVRLLLEEALAEWGAASSQERSALAEAALAFLARAPAEAGAFLLARLHGLAAEQGLEPALSSALRRALQERCAR